MKKTKDPFIHLLSFKIIQPIRVKIKFLKVIQVLQLKYMINVSRINIFEVFDIMFYDS